MHIELSRLREFAIARVERRTVNLEVALAGNRQIGAAMTQWRVALATGIRSMQTSGLVVPSADAERIAVSILAAIQGGLLLSQPERAAWPLEAALDTALDALHRMAVQPSKDRTLTDV